MVRVRSRVFAVALAVALLKAAPAAAHVTVVPPFAQARAETRLVLDVPNERLTQPMTSLDVTVPEGMAVRSAEPLGAWQAEVSRPSDAQRPVTDLLHVCRRVAGDAADDTGEKRTAGLGKMTKSGGEVHVV